MEPSQTPEQGEGDDRKRRLLLKNAQIFDGISNNTFTGHLLIDGCTIAAVDTSPIAEDSQMMVINAAGRVAMPGLTDAHVHLVGMANTVRI